MNDEELDGLRRDIGSMASPDLRIIARLLAIIAGVMLTQAYRNNRR